MLAKNEREAIEANNLCNKILKYTDDFIVMDGNSTDNTREFCKGFTSKVFVDSGKGKGAAIRNSLRKVKNQITSDAS